MNVTAKRDSPLRCMNPRTSPPLPGRSDGCKIIEGNLEVLNQLADRELRLRVRLDNPVAVVQAPRNIHLRSARELLDVAFLNHDELRVSTQKEVI